MTKTETINELIFTYGFKSYLEIGLGDGWNFNKIECNDKIGVDPVADKIKIMTGITKPQDSDTFFDWYLQEINDDPANKFDLIFIDGLHHADQVERDIINSWNALNKGGIILLHDVKPEDEAMTIIPRKQSIWTGDVFRAWHGFKETYPKIKTDYIDEQWGMGVIYKSRHRVETGFVSDISFAEYYAMKGWEPRKD